MVANLWEVTDKDIGRFGKAMLDAWLRERSSPLVACAQCRLVAELKSMSITGGKGNAKKKIPRKKLSKACSSVVCEDYCNHRTKIGSFMSQAREACTLSFFIGASPVVMVSQLVCGKRKTHSIICLKILCILGPPIIINQAKKYIAEL